MTELKDMLDDDEPNHLNELMADPYERDEFEPHHKEEECDATMLFDACYGGHVNVARLLLEYGAEVDAASWIYPCEQGPRGAHIYYYMEEVELREQMYDDRLYNKRYREFSKEEQGMEPLLIACIKGHVDVARLCLEYGADIDQWCGDRHGIVYDRITFLSGYDSESDDEEAVMTPMSVACKKENGDLIKLLLEHGADEDDVVLPSLDSACYRGDVSMVELVLEYTDDRCVETHDWRGVPRVYSQPIVRLLRKDYAMSLYLNVIGHRDEHPERQERARDVVPRVVSYLTPRARHA
jgi:hypothetical protein